MFPMSVMDQDLVISMNVGTPKWLFYNGKFSFEWMNQGDPHFRKRSYEIGMTWLVHIKNNQKGGIMGGYKGYDLIA